MQYAYRRTETVMLYSRSLGGKQAVSLSFAVWVNLGKSHNRESVIVRPLSTVGYTSVASVSTVDSGGSDCSFQRRFPIDDILFPSGDIRDQIAKAEISPHYITPSMSAIELWTVGGLYSERKKVTVCLGIAV